MDKFIAPITMLLLPRTLKFTSRVSELFLQEKAPKLLQSEIKIKRHAALCLHAQSIAGSQ